MDILANFRFIIALLILFSFTVSSEPAEDHWAPDADITTWLAIKDIRSLIESEKYSDALELLEELQMESPENAEIQNLLGYAYHKSGNIEKSLPAYQRALLLDPEHKGALEYQGELFLTLGQIEKAVDNLDKLKSMCPSGCPELDDLGNEIKDWRDGN